MFMCGDVSPEARRLCAVTKAVLDAAIRECGPGVRFSRIGAVVSKLAKAEKCVCRVAAVAVVVGVAVRKAAVRTASSCLAHSRA